MKNFLILFSFLALFLVPNTSNGQEEEKLSVKISGHIWAESIFDTRQTVTAREGDVLIFPEKEVLDANGEDINAKANYNMLNIHSRARIAITAPSFLNAKVSGLLASNKPDRYTSNRKEAQRKILFRTQYAERKLRNSLSVILQNQTLPPAGCGKSTALVNQRDNQALYIHYQ